MECNNFFFFYLLYCFYLFILSVYNFLWGVLIDLITNILLIFYWIVVGGGGGGGGRGTGGGGGGGDGGVGKGGGGGYEQLQGLVFDSLVSGFQRLELVMKFVSDFPAFVPRFSLNFFFFLIQNFPRFSLKKIVFPLEFYIDFP